MLTSRGKNSEIQLCCWRPDWTQVLSCTLGFSPSSLTLFCIRYTIKTGRIQPLWQVLVSERLSQEITHRCPCYKPHMSDLTSTEHTSEGIDGDIKPRNSNMKNIGVRPRLAQMLTPKLIFQFHLPQPLTYPPRTHCPVHSVLPLWSYPVLICLRFPRCHLQHTIKVQPVWRKSQTASHLVLLPPHCGHWDPDRRLVWWQEVEQ